VRYGLFDLNLDPLEQGLDSHGFDVVVCANVLHNATHAGDALRRLTGLVRPGGWLLFIEATRDNYPLMASMEFKEGLTDFADERAGADRTFHSRRSWTEFLAAAEADPLFCLPAEDHPLSAAGQHAFGARVKPHRAPVDADELAAHVADRLPAAMLPSKVQLLDALPLTGNGKVDRAALSARATRRGGTAETDLGEQPRTDLERRTAAIWAELLGLPSVGRDVDFYLLGGDSLLVSKLVGRLREQLPEAGRHSWDTLLRQMLRTPTVAGLAGWLEEDGGTPQSATTAARSPLVTLAPGTDQRAPARVLVHDGSGTLVPYHALIPLLSGAGPLYGLSVADPASYLAADPATLIAQLAADYREALAGTAATRFEVVGYCLGGLVATELARQLTETGAEVTRLVVVSSFRVPYTVDDELVLEYAFARLVGADPARLGYPSDEATLARALGRVLAATPGRVPAGAFAALDGDPALREVATAFARLAGRDPGERLAAIAASMAAADERPPASRPAGGDAGERAAAGEPERAGHVEAVGDALRLFRQSLDAVTAHPGDPYAGDITFLRQRGEVHFLPGLGADMTAYWHGICLGDLRVVDVPGDHFSCLAHPHVASVAAVLDGGDA
jgi:pyochelin synthetase